jgi:hypothetical protein
VIIHFFVQIMIAAASFGGPTLSQSGGQENIPEFEIELSPGEGLPVIFSVGKPILLRGIPQVAALITTTVSVRARTRLTYDSTRFQTIVPGMIRAIAPGEIRGRNLGSIKRLSRDRYYSAEFRDTTLSTATGDSVVYLQDRAEGTCFVRVGRHVIDAERCPSHFAKQFEVARVPNVLWWIRITNGDKPGWLLLQDSSAVAVDRTF